MEQILITTLSLEDLKKIINESVNLALKNFDFNNKSYESEKLLTRKETADKFKISLVTLNDWTRRGKIKSYTIGGRVLYKEQELDQALGTF
jgi:excisionase family DNA binding protein